MQVDDSERASDACVRAELKRFEPLSPRRGNRAETWGKSSAKPVWNRFRETAIRPVLNCSGLRAGRSRFAEDFEYELIVWMRQEVASC